MTQSQPTQTPGQFWQMVKAIGDRLPKDLGRGGYHQRPGWFNNQIAELVRQDPDSEKARLVEAILAGDVPEADIKELLSHIYNPFESKEVEPRLFYPEGYPQNSVGERANLLQAAYPWVDVSNVPQLETGWDLSRYPQADCLYVDLSPIALAQRLGFDLGDDWENFGLLTEQGTLAALARTRPNFTNYRAGEMGSDRHRLSQRAKDALRSLAQEQPGDVLVFPGQTGKLYAGKSVQNSRWRIEHAANPAQWPWPAYTAGHSLIGNPERLEAYEHLKMDCPGDEYSWYAGGRFDLALYFNFRGDTLKFDRYVVDDADEDYGSASGFLRQ